ncbi:hypothetical protein E8E14_003563 [Neopestalotiopsis sp. 37M]|nr:hypothetical protein E8E14_003563 [Neopestalotiopsis sp. 37M]
MAPALSYTGRILACEEYALRGEDFCKWARQPNRGVDARRSLALENRFLVFSPHDWRPWHLLLILLVAVCVVFLARDELFLGGGGGGGGADPNAAAAAAGLTTTTKPDTSEEEKSSMRYKSGSVDERGAASTSFQRSIRRKVDNVAERAELPWKCS